MSNGPRKKRKRKEERRVVVARGEEVGKGGGTR